MVHSEQKLKQVWLLIRNGITKSKLKSILQLPDAEIQDLYQQATAKFGRGAYNTKVKESTVKTIITQNLEPESKPFVRPPAVYTNTGYLSTIEKYK